MSTTGTRQSAAIVIMDKVYSVEAAFRIVRLQSGFRLDTISRGNSAEKNPAEIQTILRPVKINARSSFRCFNTGE